MKRFLFRDFPLLALLILVAFLPRLPLLYLKGFDIFDSDQAVLGIMAKHILEGKPMIYFYGQGYMGSLGAFVVAFIFLIGRMNALAIQWASLAFYLLFLIVNFYLLKRVFGLAVSFIMNLLLAISPFPLSVLSTTNYAYTELLFFGSLTLLGFVHYSEFKDPKTLFVTGVFSGIGFWSNNLILMYFFTVGLLAWLRSNFWKKHYNFLSWRRLFLLENMGLPDFLRFVGIAIHVAISIYGLSQMFSFLTGIEGFSVAGLKMRIAHPPFPVRHLKKILILLSVEISALCLQTFGMRKTWQNVKPSLPLLGGFLLGISPALSYALSGLKGYRLIHDSGMVYAKDLPTQFDKVIWEGFVQSVWGVPVEFLFSGMGVKTLVAWSILLSSSVLLFCFCLGNKKELGNLFRLRPSHYSYQLFPILLTAITLFIGFFNNLQADRYLITLSFALPLIFALSLSQMKGKIGVVLWFLFVLLLASQAYANFYGIQNIPNQGLLKKGDKSVLEFLNERKIKGAYANYWISYVLTFESHERLIVAPYRSLDRYPAYTKYVSQLTQVAYIFLENDALWPSFQKNLEEHRISYEKVGIRPFWLFLIDRTKRTELGIV